MFKRGFTLAEVLITLGVIGVVAALTIPSLSSNYQKRVLTTQLQKAYAELSQAGAMALADEMGGDFRQSKTLRDGNFVNKFVKASGSSTFADSYDIYNCNGCGSKSMSNINNFYNNKNYSCGKLGMGASFCVNREGDGFLDINSNKGPNQIGRDMFMIGFGTDGTIGEYDHALRSIIRADWDIDDVYDAGRGF